MEEYNKKEWGGGNFSGRVYFSEEKPQGIQDTLKFDPGLRKILGVVSEKLPELTDGCDAIGTFGLQPETN